MTMNMAQVTGLATSGAPVAAWEQYGTLLWSAAGSSSPSPSSSATPSANYLAVSGAGDPDTDGNYELISGTWNTRSAVYGLNGYNVKTIEYSEIYGMWVLLSQTHDQDVRYYFNDMSGASTLPLSGDGSEIERWEPANGASPAPTVSLPASSSSSASVTPYLTVSGAGDPAANGTWTLRTGIHGTNSAFYRKAGTNRDICYDSTYGCWWIDIGSQLIVRSYVSSGSLLTDPFVVRGSAAEPAPTVTAYPAL